MATGDQADVFARLKSLMPDWFGADQGPTPVLDALLQAPAWALSWVYSLYAYAKQQTRISTATDVWLDAISTDFFGLSLLRKAGQNDASFRASILATLLRRKATRPALFQALTSLTGIGPVIFEPNRPADTGGWNIASSLGYGSAGGYGCQTNIPQVMITAYRTGRVGLPNVGGYNTVVGGYNIPSQIEWLGAVVTTADSDIYAAAEAVRPAGVAYWVSIAPAPVNAVVLTSYNPAALDNTYFDRADNLTPAYVP